MQRVDPLARRARRLRPLRLLPRREVLRAATRRACEQPPKLPSMSDNVYFMESELCMGTLNDKCVDKLHKKREPKHWNAKHSTTQSAPAGSK